MAVNNYLSTTLTNRDKLPQLPNDLRGAGRPFSKEEINTVVTGDSVGSTYRYYSLRSDAKVKGVRISAPDIGTTTAANVGLYDTTANGGAVVNATLFASGVVLNAGPITRSEVAIGAGITVANANKKIWELLGLASDPNKEYDLVLTLSGAADAGGAVLVETDYKVQ